MDFTEKYKTFSNTDLYRIIGSPDDYQPEAVETARTIFESRQINEKELEIIEIELANEKKVEEDKEQKKKAFENKTKSFVSKLLEKINPIQSKVLAPDKLANLIGVFFCLMAIYNVIIGFDFILLLFTDDSIFENIDISLLLPILSFAIIPIAALLFLLKKKSGWALLAITLIYIIISAIVSIISIMRWQQDSHSCFDTLFPEPSPAVYIWRMLFYSGILAVICKKNIREIFNVDKLFMITTIGIFGFLTALAYFRLVF